jgi:N-acyl homoserine lactone hydrolase
MKIHAISTGAVQITRAWIDAKDDGLRLVRTLGDSTFTEWMPVWCFVIEHPDGLTVVDTGSMADAAPVLFPPWMPLLARAARIRLTPDEEIGPLMLKRGLDPKDVRRVILTHLHQDHDGGMKYFPDAEFIIAREEWAAASGMAGRMGGYMNFRWPEWLAPTLVDFDQEPYGSFPASHALTPSSDIRLVPTHGHSLGHMSVVIEEDSQAVMMAGDASYSQALLLADAIDGVGPSTAEQRLTHRRIVEFAASRPTVYLPSHEWDAERRLAAREVIGGDAAGAAAPLAQGLMPDAQAAPE